MQNAGRRSGCSNTDNATGKTPFEQIVELLVAHGVEFIGAT
jgi:hypothetical protein